MKLNRFSRSKRSAVDRAKQSVINSASKARRMMVEPLEDRQMLSLTVDLRVFGASNPKVATVTAVGQQITIQEWVTVSGTQTVGSYTDGVASVTGSVLSSKTTTGSINGNLSNNIVPPYTALGASNGTQQDLNKDGNLDVGSNVDSDIAGFINARAGSVQTTGGVISGDSQSFVVSVLHYTVTSLSSGKATDINFRFRNGIPAGAFDAVWLQDGVGQNDQFGTALVGAPIVVSAPGVTPPPTGTISGTVYKSVNGSVSAFSGQTMYLDLNDTGSLVSGDPTAVTSSTGAYSFTGLAPATYFLREVVPSGYSQTVPSSTPTLLTISSAGDSFVGENFTDTAITAKVGSISGTVYKAATGSTTIGFAGVTVYLDNNNDGVFDSGDTSVTTGSTGTYSFGSLPASTYHVREVVPSGYSQTSPSTSPTNVTLSAGGIVTGQNFTDTATVNTSTGNIAGTVYDINNGSTVAAGGVTVYLDSNNDGLLDNGEYSMTTSTTGAYAFGTLPAGTYHIREVVPSGYTQTSPAAGVPVTVTLTTGQKVTGENITNTLNANTNGSLLSGTVIGTSGSYLNDGNTIAKAFDGNFSTFFDGPTANGNWAGLNLGAQYVITKVSYAPRSGWSSRMVGGIFQGSNSSTFSSGVTNLATITVAPSTGLFTSVTITNTSSFEFVRYLGANGSYGDVAELQFYGTPAKTTVHTKLTGTVIGTSGSYLNDGNTIAKAFDGSLTTFFDGATANGNWAGLDTGSAQAVTQITFAPRSGYASRMIGGIFQASNSATFSTGVVNLYTISSAPTTGSLTTVSVSATGYRYFRYLSPNGSYGDVAEIGFYS